MGILFKKRLEKMNKERKLCDYFEECSGHFEYLQNINDELCNTLQNLYCKSNCEGCARFLVSEKLGKYNTPRDLLPSQEVRACSIVQEAQKLYS